METIKFTFKNEGINGFYKGFPSVVSTVAIVKAIVFTSYE